MRSLPVLRERDNINSPSSFVDSLGIPDPFPADTASGLTLTEYAGRYLRILDEEKRNIPLSPNRAQAHYEQHKTGRDLILKARQLGFSTWLQAEVYQHATSQTAAAVTICDVDNNTQRFRRVQDRFHENHPYPANRRYANAALTTYVDLDSEHEVMTAGRKSSGRSGSYTFVHGSEVAFWSDGDAIMSGLMQGIPYGKGRIVLESTANGAQGWFYERCMEALDGDSEWTLHFYAWWWDESYAIPLDEGEVLMYTPDEHDAIRRAADNGFDLTPEQIKWRRVKKRELPHTFAQEYPEDIETAFLTSGNSYFGDISHCYGAPQQPVYVTDHVYVAGLDFGQYPDYTVLSIWNATTLEEVEILRIRSHKWQHMRQQVAMACHKWNVRLCVGEKNSMGKTNTELLRDGEYDAEGNKLYDGISLVDFQTTAQSKPPAVQALYNALHHEGLQLLPDSIGRHEMRNFVSKQTANNNWRYEAASGHDDIVIARMLANHARRRIPNDEPEIIRFSLGAQ